jgi:hypothetical protein
MRATNAPRGEPGQRCQPPRHERGAGAGGGPTPGASWRPLAGPALLERLRVTGRPRPVVDPDFTADLRDHLESGLEDLSAAWAAADGGRLAITKDRLTRALSCPMHRSADRFGERTLTLPLACGALVGVLFRQLVTVGAIGDPMTDALDGLAMDDRQAPLVAWILTLPDTDRSELQAEVGRQARGLVDRWPALQASWLPRTQEVLRTVLAGGTVELAARVDLAVGRSADKEATVALVEVTSGARRPGHRDDLHFAALVETLRSAAPPFSVATYYTRTGELDVEPVTNEMLVDAVRRTVAGARGMVDGDAGSVDGARCAACAAVPRYPGGTGRIATPAAPGPTVVPFPHGRAA